MVLLREEHTFYQTRVLETGKTCYSEYKPRDILEAGCIQGGSTIEGRQAAAGKLLNTNRMIPIPVYPKRGIYMFPTTSNKSKQCIWLSYYHIHSYEERAAGTHIRFIDGTGMDILVSIYTIDKQYKKTSQVIAETLRHQYFPDLLLR